jgi:Domain of unknown function (DUF4186)
MRSLLRGFRQCEAWLGVGQCRWRLCRSCLERWHQIPKGRDLSREERGYVVDVICRWIEREVLPWYRTVRSPADPAIPGIRHGRFLGWCASQTNVIAAATAGAGLTGQSRGG